MDTVYEGLCLAACTLDWSLTDAFTSCSHELSHRSVGKEHELFYEPVCFLGNLLIYIYRTSLLVDLDLHLRSVEADGSGCKSFLAQLGCKAVEHKDSISDLCRNSLMGHSRTSLNDSLSSFICKTEV